MELDLDLSVTRASENLTFASTETEAVFILLGHLPGFVQDKIEIWVNEAGREISISSGGDKSSLETVIGRRLRLKNEFQTNPFRKVFRIPNGVALGQIDASFYEEQAILMILMPKSVKGEVSGTEIEEVQEEREAPREKRIEGDELIPTDRPPHVGGAEIEDARAPNEEEIEQGKEEEAPIGREGTEEKFDQNGVESSGSDRIGDRETKHIEAEIENPKEEGEEEEEEPRELPDRPQTPSTKMEEPDLDGEPPPSVASEPINEAEQKDSIEETIDAYQRMEKEDEAPEADRDLHQPEEQQTDTDHQTEQEDQVHELEQQENREVPESFEAPKSDRDLRQPEEKTNTGEVSDQFPLRSGDEVEQATKQAPETEKPIEEDEEESSPDEEGENRRGNGSKGKRRRRDRRRRDVAAPSLMVSAFLLSLVALVVQLVRNRRRR